MFQILFKFEEEQKRTDIGLFKNTNVPKSAQAFQSENVT